MSALLAAVIGRWFCGWFLVLCVVAFSGNARATDGRLAVLGFQSDSDSPKLIDRNTRAMTVVGVDGVNLVAPGRVSHPGSADLMARAQASAHGLPAVLLIGNWSPAINDFSERLAHQTLGNPAYVRKAASAVATDAVRGGWSGVSVDLESLSPRDTAGLSAFLRAVRLALPSGDSLTVCVEAFTSPAAYRANGYELQACAANQIVLMTYDDHGPWENDPGPIGPLSWQHASVHALEHRFRPQRSFWAPLTTDTPGGPTQMTT